jgi:hypothetical protein
MFERAIERTRRLGDYWLTAQTLREYAAAEMLNDAFESGIDHILDAEALCTEYGLNDLLVGVRALAARLLLRGKRLPEALERASVAMRELRKGVEFAHLVPLALSEVQDAMGNTDEGTRSIEAARSQLSAMLEDLEPEERARSWARVPNHAAIHARWMATAPTTANFELPAVDAPLGRALKADETVTVTLTIHDPGDGRIVDQVERRRRRLLRIVEQARSQGAAPTIGDLSTIVEVSEATVRRDLAAIRESGTEIATRGSR